jgi:hypothetical protein
MSAAWAWTVEIPAEESALHGEIDTWRAQWDVIALMGGCAARLDVLNSVAVGPVKVIGGGTGAIDSAARTGQWRTPRHQGRASQRVGGAAW